MAPRHQSSRMKIVSKESMAEIMKTFKAWFFVFLFLVCIAGFFFGFVVLIGRIELFPVEQRVKVLEDKVRLLQQK